MGARTKIETLKDLVNQYLTAMDSKSKDKFNKIYKKLIEIVETRNKVVHANWGTLEKDGYVRVKTISNKDSGFISFKKEKINAKLLTKMCVDMEKLDESLYELLESERIA